MITSRVFCSILLALLSVCASFGYSEEPNVELPKRLEFIQAYNGKPAEQRLAALSIMTGCKEDKSLETLFYVSWIDQDPEIRSRAFSVMVNCEDTYGYVAHLAAESLRVETEVGVKAEKAVGMGNLKYKWAALNELVHYLRTLRWNTWNWGYNGYHQSGGYIGSGNPPPVPGYPEDQKPVDPGYEQWRKRQPLRWRNENELIGLITATINKLSGTQMEARPRIDQEIVKWWDRKCDLWEEYDRKLRTATLNSSKEVKFKAFSELKFDDVHPGKGTLGDLLKDSKPAKDGKTVEGVAVRSVMDDD